MLYTKKTAIGSLTVSIDPVGPPDSISNHFTICKKIWKAFITAFTKRILCYFYLISDLSQYISRKVTLKTGFIRNIGHDEFLDIFNWLLLPLQEKQFSTKKKNACVNSCLFSEVFKIFLMLSAKMFGQKYLKSHK